MVFWSKHNVNFDSNVMTSMMRLGRPMSKVRTGLGSTFTQRRSFYFGPLSRASNKTVFGRDQRRRFQHIEPLPGLSDSSLSVSARFLSSATSPCSAANLGKQNHCASTLSREQRCTLSTRLPQARCFSRTASRLQRENAALKEELGKDTNR